MDKPKHKIRYGIKQTKKLWRRLYSIKIQNKNNKLAEHIEKMYNMNEA